jgi:hypothetical protein
MQRLLFVWCICSKENFKWEKDVELSHRCYLHLVRAWAGSGSSVGSLLLRVVVVIGISIVVWVVELRKKGHDFGVNCQNNGRSVACNALSLQPIPKLLINFAHAHRVAFFVGALQGQVLRNQLVRSSHNVERLNVRAELFDGDGSKTRDFGEVPRDIAQTKTLHGVTRHLCVVAIGIGTTASERSKEHVVRIQTHTLVIVV